MYIRTITYRMKRGLDDAESRARFRMDVHSRLRDTTGLVHVAHVPNGDGSHRVIAVYDDLEAARAATARVTEVWHSQDHWLDGPPEFHLLETREIPPDPQ